jgi:hypothetical protein
MIPSSPLEGFNKKDRPRRNESSSDAVLLNDGHHRFTYPDDKSDEAIAVELKSTRFGENKRARLGDRGECARCRNGDLL